MRESALEKKCCDHARTQGWHNYKLGQSGDPDRVFVKAGWCFLVEFKRPSNRGAKFDAEHGNGRPSPRQSLKIKKLNEEGTPAFFAADFDFFKTMLKQIDGVLPRLTEDKNNVPRNAPAD